MPSRASRMKAVSVAKPRAASAGSEGIQVNGTGTFELTGRPN